MKKLTCFLLTMLLVLSLFGCNAAPAQTPATTVPTVPATTEPAFNWYDENTVTITAQQVDSIVSSDFTAPKNIILLIGDGMGPNDITLCREYGKDNYDFGLVLDRIPHHSLRQQQRY